MTNETLQTLLTRGRIFHCEYNGEKRLLQVQEETSPGPCGPYIKARNHMGEFKSFSFRKMQNVNVCSQQEGNLIYRQSFAHLDA